MKRILNVFISLLLLIILLSCSDSILGSGTDKSLSDITVKSLKSGGILKKGQRITFSILSPGSGDIPDRLVINLATMASESVKRLETKAFTLNNDINLDPFDSILTGQYKLEFTIYAGDTLLASKNISFFYTDSDFNFKGVETFPSGIYPGAHVLLRSGLQVPSNADPFLRWSIGDKTIAKGRASEGISKIIWTAPEDEGVYTIRVELFPVAPTGTEDYGFKSEVFMDVEIFVSKMQSPSHLKLLPEASYFSLFHLDGNFADSGSGINNETSKKQEKPKGFPIGNPELVTKEDDFGYAINNSSGFTIPYCIFPTRDGHLEPFTLSMGLDFDEQQKDKTVFSYVSEDNSFDLVILIDGFSNLSAQMKLGSQVFILPSEINVTNLKKRFLLSFSFIPSPANATVIWYLDGIGTNKVIVGISGYGTVSSAGVASIGGEHGVSGSIDEIGTYYRDGKGRSAVDSGLFKSAMVQKYQDSLVFAEGFEGLFVPDSIESRGKVWMDNGELTFESEVAIRIDNIPKNNSPFSVSLDFSSFSDELGRVEFFWDKATKPFLTVGSSGKILTGEKEVPKLLSGASKSIRFKIHESDTLVSFASDKALRNLSIEKPESGPLPLVIKIINSDSKKPASLATVSVFAEKK